MILDRFSLKAIRLFLLIAAAIVILSIEITMQASLAFAGNRGDFNSINATPTRTKRPEKLPPAIQVSSRLCGELIYLTDYKSGVSNIGLLPCGGGAPYIFKIHPRDQVGFYQIRDPKIKIGKEFCTTEYGCLNRYITSFKNYIGLDSCAVCGKSMAPPTWTQVPLTPYTPTPIPPTRTPWPTPVSPTPSPTLSPDEITPTLDLFQLLYGTGAPTSSATFETQLILTGTPTGQISESTPVGTTVPVKPFYRRTELVSLILLALLALLIPLVFLLRDYLRDR